MTDDLDPEAFRAEARDWLEANFPKSLSGRAAAMMARMDGGVFDDDMLAWKQAMGARGWGTPAWPARYGGGGLTPACARVLQQEMARVGAFNPMTHGMGVTMIGPTLLDYGTEAQKLKHLPAIVRGE